jgi:TfoX/Sxy family transcriptional regulator of competence genes
MAYDEVLASRIRDRIGDHRALTEKPMFGGLAFMIGGNMAVGVHHDELMVRVGKDTHDEAVARPGARIFDLSSKPMRGWIVVAPAGFTDDDELDDWVERGRRYAEGLPPK